MFHQPRKRFGQNFLQDKTVVEKIIQVVCPKQNERLVEIGPGNGALTVDFLTCVNHLDVIEIDRDLIPHLMRLTQKAEQLTVHQADALKFNYKSLVHNQDKLRIIGNLPYNISTPLLFHLFSQAEVIKDMHFMLQREVADRLSAKVGTKAYGRLSIMAQYYCQIEKVFDVPPEAFFPAPKVYSAFVRLTPYVVLPHTACDADQLSSIVAKAFMQRRKTLRNALKGVVSVSRLEALNIDPGLRPEQVTLEQYIRIVTDSQCV